LGDAAGEQLQAWPWADLLHNLAYPLRLRAVLASGLVEPTDLGAIQKGATAPNAQQHKLMGQSPVVADSEYRLRPDKAAFVFKAPSFDDGLAVKEKGVRRPKVKVRVFSGQLGDGQGGDLLDRQAAVVVAGRGSRALVLIEPRRIGVDGAKLHPSVNQDLKLSCRASAKEGRGFKAPAVALVA